VRLRLTGAVLVLLGLVAAGTAVASATLWRPADHVQAEALASGATATLVTQPGVLELVADTVTVRATAPQGTRVVVAVGREADVRAWVGSDPHTLVTGLADIATLDTRPGDAVEAPVASPTPSPQPTSTPGGPVEPDDAAEDTAVEDAPGQEADPAGSDMWIVQAEGLGATEISWTHRPGRWSLLVATTGTDAGQPTLELTWPREVVTPWFRPGLWVGCALVLVGAAVIVLGWRRSRADAAEWVDVETDAGVEAEEVVPVAAPEVPAVPLTRRQLRELEAARGSGRAARPVVPTVRRSGPPPTVAEPERPGAPEPAEAAPVAGPAEAAPAPAPAHASAPAAAPYVPTPPAPVEDAPYVPAFVPTRRGGVVPHIPSGPAAPARQVPTAQSVPASRPAPTAQPASAPQPARGPQPAPGPQPPQPTQPVQPSQPAPSVARWTPTGPTAPAAAPAATPVWPTMTPATPVSSGPPPAALAPEPDLPAEQTPDRGGSAMRRLLRRKDSATEAAPVGPPEKVAPEPEPPAAPPVEPGVARAETAHTGTASADAWRARWGFVETPSAQSDGDQDGGER